MQKVAKVKEKIEVDLEGRTLGRAASEVAFILRGKKRADFAPNKVPEITLEIKNCNKLKIDEKKMGAKIYKRYSGYPSGLKFTKLEELYRKNPREVFLRAVKGMLPRNRLRKNIIKNIVWA